MRAALYYGRQDLRLTSVPEPQPGPGEVKLRVRYNGICGSDLLEYYDGPITTRSTPHPLTGVQNPVIMGHELCGEVVALGEGIDDLIGVSRDGNDPAGLSHCAQLDSRRHAQGARRHMFECCAAVRSELVCGHEEL